LKKVMTMQFRRLWVVLGVAPVALGCYQYTPLDTSAGVQAGEHVAVEITDRGRAELGDRLGTGVLRLEGTLTRTDSVNLEMNVWRVAHFSGPASRWSGESIRLRREFASRVQSRTLNRGKTYLLAGSAVVGFVLFTSQFDLLGFASENGATDSLPPPSSSRGWWP
jgi:hypothetical protein